MDKLLLPWEIIAVILGYANRTNVPLCKKYIDKYWKITLNHSPYVEDIFNKASEYGYIEIVKSLLADSRINPSDNYNYAICWASQNGHLECVN